MSSIWNLLVVIGMKLGIPMILVYFSICSHPFLNTAAQDATGLEKIANELLTPFQYFFVGKTAVPKTVDGEVFYEFERRFNYEKNFCIKTSASFISLLPSFSFGSLLKTLSLLSSEVRTRHKSILSSIDSTKVFSNKKRYEELGLNFGDLQNAQRLTCQGYKRRPADIHHMKDTKIALKKIVEILTKKEIPFWVDCGTLLGTYRYGGMIPWDHDADMAILQDDFDNVLRALNDLDKEKYIVMDWSSRDIPKSLLKVFVKKTQKMIDIYQFKADPDKKTVQLIFYYEKHNFFPQWWKDRELPFQTPFSYETVFPLKKATFDGIEVFVPNQTEKYLQTFYGENISPVKIYDEKTCEYEKDLSHPYWERANVY